jgi:hypothetical protein
VAFLPDLSVCTYFPIEHGGVLRAIGWLEPSQPFPTGATAASVYSRLCELLVDPWQPFVAAGFHDCTLCQFHGEAQGRANLFVPNGTFIYVCPDLITHYINAHHYQPPEEFCRAVVACPDTRSMEYKRLLLSSGGRVLVQKLTTRSS